MNGYSDDIMRKWHVVCEKATNFDSETIPAVIEENEGKGWTLHSYKLSKKMSRYSHFLLFYRDDG